MKRYEKIMLEAENGITFEVSEGRSGKLIVRDLKITANYVNPIIPDFGRKKMGKRT